MMQEESTNVEANNLVRTSMQSARTTTRAVMDEAFGNRPVDLAR